MVFVLIFLISLNIFSFNEDNFNKSLDWVVELSKYYEIMDEHPDLEKINRIGYSLVQNLEDKNLYSFQIVKMKEANAFALPGGFIFLTSGMLDLKLSDDGLAALLAHEIIHVKNEHSLKMEKRQTLLSALSNVLILGALFGIKDEAPKSSAPPWYTVPDSKWGDLYGYETKKENIIEGAIAFSVVFQELLMQGYSREFEMESDREGTFLMAQAGYRPHGVVELLDKLKSRYYETPDLGYWRSHPYLEDRVEMANVRVQQLKEAQEKKNPLKFQKKIQEKFYLLYLQEKKEDKKRILFKISKNSCPQGVLSFELNLKELWELEKKYLISNQIDRNYERVLEKYRKIIKNFEADNEVAFSLKKLKTRYEKIEEEKRDCFDIFEKHFYESFPSTNYLEAYYENYKDTTENPFPLIFYGTNLLRLGNEEKGAKILIEIYNKFGIEIKERVLEEISLFSKNMKNLNALYEVSSNFKEKFVKKNFENLFLENLKRNESLLELRKFLDNYPKSPFYGFVFEKLEELANKAYIKGRAFKSVGNYQATLDIYNKILENAYDTKIAEKIRKELKEGGKI